MLETIFHVIGAQRTRDRRVSVDSRESVNRHQRIPALDRKILEISHEGRKGGEGGGCSARFTGIEIENSRFTGIKTDFSRITHNSAFALIFQPCTCSFPPSFLSVAHFFRHLYPA